MTRLNRRRFGQLVAAGVGGLLGGLGRAQSQRPWLQFRLIEENRIPPEIAAQAIVFPRAYVVCPESERGRRAFYRSRYPHADSDLVSFGNIAPPPPGETDVITVTTAVSGDGRSSYRDASLRVPLAISWPGNLIPREAPEILISHIDVMPTLLGLRGVPLGAEMQGRDLSALLLGGSGSVPDSIFAEGALGTADEWRVVIRGYDKLVVNLSVLNSSMPGMEDVEALYNLADDPAEQYNLVKPADVDRMRGARANSREVIAEPPPAVQPASVFGRPRPTDQAQREAAAEVNQAAILRKSRITVDSLLALARDWQRRTRDGMDPSGLRIRRPGLVRRPAGEQ